MNGQIFRKKSMEQVNSPEQLNDYVRVANPGIWMILSALIILLAGVCIWSVFGHLDTALGTVGVCENGLLQCYVSDTDISQVKPGMEITAGEKKYEITSVSRKPIFVDENIDAYLIHKGNLQPGQWVYTVTAHTDLSNGIYEAKIITESISPISFVLN